VVGSCRSCCDCCGQKYHGQKSENLKEHCLELDCRIRLCPACQKKCIFKPDENGRDNSRRMCRFCATDKSCRIKS
jgi:hypothetical protein